MVGSFVGEKEKEKGEGRIVRLADSITSGKVFADIEVIRERYSLDDLTRRDRMRWNHKRRAWRNDFESAIIPLPCSMYIILYQD